MKQVQVRTRPMGGVCRVRVDGLEQARWLLDWLSRSFVFKTCEPILEDANPLSCTFRVAYSSQVSPARLDSLLAAIPEVCLSRDAG